MYDATTVALAMHRWLNMSTNREQPQYAVDFIHDPFGHPPKDAPSDVLDQAIEVVTTDVMIIRIKEACSDPSLIDGAIEDECVEFKPFVLANHPWSRAFITPRVYDVVARALQRQLEAGLPRHSWDVLHPGYYLNSACRDVPSGLGQNVLILFSVLYRNFPKTTDFGCRGLDGKYSCLRDCDSRSYCGGAERFRFAS